MKQPMNISSNGSLERYETLLPLLLQNSINIEWSAISVFVELDEALSVDQLAKVVNHLHPDRVSITDTYSFVLIWSPKRGCND